MQTSDFEFNPEYYSKLDFSRMGIMCNCLHRQRKDQKKQRIWNPVVAWTNHAGVLLFYTSLDLIGEPN